MSWKLEEALDFCRSLNEFVAPFGFGVGLTGGVLAKGSSQKDLDLIIFPFKKKSANWFKLIWELTNFGLVYVRLPNHNKGYEDDGKKVQVWEYQGKRIDLFFLD
jgi:hypothetical protein